jgi:hypothetical protein
MSLFSTFKPGKIYDSKQYDAFKLSNNRPVDRKRVEQLKKDMQVSDYGKSFPIIISKNGVVRDGQHRFTARKELKLPIYFHVSEQTLNLDAVAKTNSMQKAWSTDDHILSRARSGNKTFQAIENFAISNDLKASQAISFFRGDGSSDIRKGILRGEIVDIAQSQINEAQKILNIWKSFRVYIPKMDYRSAVSACKRLVKTRGYNHDRMIHQINKNPRRFVPCVDSEMYLQMFEEVYNYEFHKKNRLKFTIDK